MLLSDFIKQLGDEAAAELFGVKPRTAQSWRLGERFPRPKQAREVVERTKGEVSLEEVYAVREPA
jgi:DNA-binding transcriptional regulator YdaS (Cro superfamily)